MLGDAEVTEVANCATDWVFGHVSRAKSAALHAVDNSSARDSVQRSPDA